jgi:hypothetical protein
VQCWNPREADILFLAGLDWEMPDENSADYPPIVNLIQGARHAHRGDVRFRFLTLRAIRICVSDEVSSRIKETGCVNGPVFTIQNGIDIDVLPPRAATGEHDIPVFISGLKNPEFVRTLGNLLSREE